MVAGSRPRGATAKREGARIRRRREPGTAGAGIRSAGAGLTGLLVGLLLVADASAAAAQEVGTLTGRLVAPTGAPAAGADLRLVNLGRTVRADSAGAFRFADVPPGSHLLEARGQQGYASERVDVRAGEAVSVEIVLRRVFHGEAIVVSVGPVARRQSETFRSTEVLEGDELRRQSEASLGETLREEPGVHASSFGPGSSRPVIRGLGGDRVRVLERGVGSGDASSTSPDHAVGVEPVAAERIEVIRGPATLLYGSAAIGGVVNVVDRRIPTELPSRPVTGRLLGRGGTVADEFTGAAELNGAVGPLGWHVSGLARDAGNYAIPGPAEVGAAGSGGALPNSFVETQRGAAGLSWIAGGGYLGVSFSTLDSEYGIPGVERAHGAEGDEPSELPFIDLQQRRFDAEGSWRFASPFLETVKLRAGVSDYRHFEMEGPGEIGTRFENDAWEVRGEAQHRISGRLGGAFGVQLSSRDFAALGEEAFVPPTETDVLALFLFEELDLGAWRVQAGGRLETQNVSNVPAAIERDEEALSASLGVNWSPRSELTLGLTGARSVKLPNAEELYSDGPHLATNAFEVGSPELTGEIGWSLDASARLRTERVQATLTAFVNRFDDFIFQALTGTREEGLPVLLYSQADALFTGFEAEGIFGLVHDDEADRHLRVDVRVDWVRAELTATDEPLPRIPPLRLGTGLTFEAGAWTGRVGVTRLTEQDRTAAFETPTAGYTILDGSAGFRFVTAGLAHDVTLRGTNLGDEEARNHVSFLKDVAPLPGRELRLTWTVAF